MAAKKRYPAPPGATVLERDRRLSQSRLWEWQRRFFVAAGIEAWRQGIVPHYVTSNPTIAHAYARVVLGFLRDCLSGSPPLDLRRPLYIVELGAGSGRFAYLFLQAFLPLWQHSRLRGVPITYVLTDFAERTVAYWQQHTSLAPFVEAGLLDFARYDFERDTTLTLTRSGATLAPGAVANPLVVLANYFFDSVPQDAFRVRAGRLYESRVTLTTPTPEPDLTDPQILSRVLLTYQDRLARLPYYGDADLDAVLAAYPRQVADTTLLFPGVALRGLRALRALAGGRMLLLSGDKGYIRDADLAAHPSQGFARHGSVSLLVNYHALGAYARNSGGQVLHPTHPAAHLTVAAFLWGAPPEGYVETAGAYADAILRGGPDDFYSLKKGLEPHYATLTLAQLLAYLRLSGGDGNIFRGCLPALVTHASRDTLAAGERLALYQAVEQVWAMHYPIGEEPDLAVYLGILLAQLGYATEARALFNTIEDGADAPTPDLDAPSGPETMGSK